MTQALNQRRHVLSSVYFLNVTTYVGAQLRGRGGGDIHRCQAVRSSELCSSTRTGFAVFTDLVVCTFLRMLLKSRESSNLLACCSFEGLV